MERGKVFRIGIAMAGAVSAGAYTAGVIDYLLETLDSWEKAKQANRVAEAEGRYEDIDESVPMHDVVLEVMGGASAGGMTAAITTLGLYDNIPPIYEDSEGDSPNPLYQAWVNLNDNASTEDTLLQMLSTDDIKDNKVASLLNSKPIDRIAQKAVNLATVRYPQSEKWPRFVSPQMELILTICSLRGIPVELDFGSSGEFDDPKPNSIPAHEMYMHKGVGHFTIDVKKGFEHDHLLGMPLAWHGPEGASPEAVLAARNIIVETAKASGAFPGGLQPRLLPGVPRAYLKAHIIRTFGNSNININWQRIPEYFNFTAVDGGTINNEPFDDVLRVLEERYEEDVASGMVDKDKDAKNFALIMIDPFPSFLEGTAKEPEYEGVDTLSGVAVGVFTAVRRQAMIKESELSKGFAGDYTRAMIFPVRRSKTSGPEYKKEKHAIACGSLSGFGGFFSREFRVHDYALGRKNCQSFLRKHFSLTEVRTKRYDVVAEAKEEAIKQSIFKGIGPSHPIYKRFHYMKDGDAHLPIIPDMRIEEASSEIPEKNGTLPSLPYPQISVKQLKKYQKPMRKRLNAVIKAMLKNAIKSSDKPDAEKEKFAKTIQKLVSKHLASSLLVRVFQIILLVIALPIILLFIPVLLLVYSIFLSIVVKKLFYNIVYDFKMRGLLKE